MVIFHKGDSWMLENDIENSRATGVYLAGKATDIIRKSLASLSMEESREARNFSTFVGGKFTCCWMFSVRRFRMCAGRNGFRTFAFSGRTNLRHVHLTWTVSILQNGRNPWGACSSRNRRNCDYIFFWMVKHLWAQNSGCHDGEFWHVWGQKYNDCKLYREKICSRECGWLSRGEDKMIYFK